MRNHGFTFVELLIVMVFIGIIILIIVPNLSGLLKQSNDNKYKSFLGDIYLATEAYVQKNIDDYPLLKEEGYAYVYISDLVNSHYLRSTVMNPKNKETISKELFYTIIVTKTEDSGYQYELVEKKLTP